MALTQYIHFHQDVNPEDIQVTHPYLVQMIGYASMWCLQHNITTVVTSWTRDIDDFSQSMTHQEGRAVDMSLHAQWGWTDKLRDEFEKEMTEVFTGKVPMKLENGKTITMDYAAISSDGKGGYIKRPIVRHNIGRGDHWHIQCKPLVKTLTGD